MLRGVVSGVGVSAALGCAQGSPGRMSACENMSETGCSRRLAAGECVLVQHRAILESLCGCAAQCFIGGEGDMSCSQYEGTRIKVNINNMWAVFAFAVE